MWIIVDKMFISKYQNNKGVSFKLIHGISSYSYLFSLFKIKKEYNNKVVV